MSSILRLRAEFSKAFGLPIVLTYGIIFAALGIMVLGSMGEEAARGIAPAPATLATSPAGALVIASQQIGTVTGLVSTGLFVSLTLATNLEQGGANSMFLQDPRRTPFALRSLLVSWIYCGPLAIATFAAALWISANVNSVRLDQLEGTNIPSAAAALSAITAALGTQLHYTSMSAACAFLTRSMPATILLSVGPYFVSLPLSSVDSIDAWLPHQWAATLLDLNVENRWIYYVWCANGEYVSVVGSVCALIVCTGLAIGVSLWAVRGERVLRGSE